MAKAPTRPKAKEEETVIPPSHDAPGLTPLERMTDLTRRVINVPKAEVDRTRKKRGH